MKGRIEKRGLVQANRMLTGILSAALVMSSLSGTGLVVQAAEVEMTSEEALQTEEQISQEEITVETQTEDVVQELEEITETESEESTEVESEEIITEESTEVESEETLTEESTEVESEETLTEEITAEDILFASVYLQFDANGGTCDVSMIELTPDNMELVLPQAVKAGWRFVGWYMDEECTIAFDENNIFWEAGSTYVLYAGYEQQEMDEISLIERTLQKSVNGVTITVEGKMPEEAILEVRAEELTSSEQENLVKESDIVASADELDTEQNTSYSYDITICYQDVEYEPYLFDEMMQVTFSFADAQELKDAGQMEIFHIDDNENVEKIDIKEVSESKVSFEADAFSTYILITKIEYIGNKEWSYGFTGDVQSFTAPVAGQYTFECYGAGTESSKGGFAKGTIGLKKNETVYIYVGGQNNTFNGGGAGGAVWHSSSNSGGSFGDTVYSDNGCGATDVRVGTELETRLIVAGGGGGNGHNGGVNYSYNGSVVSHGPFYQSISATNQVSSNGIPGQGSSYSTWVNSGDWGSGSYPNYGTYNFRTVTGGGGGGYYGGKNGCAGTSEIAQDVMYQGKEYQTSNSIIQNLVYEGNGKCQISLYSLEADVITYYDHNMTKLGEAAGLTGSYVNFPDITQTPVRESDSKYDYSYLGWDDMATEEIEHYTDAETVAAAMSGDRNYIAVYEEIGKTYTVLLDSADAQNKGTTDVTATYHRTLPDIMIPSKDGVIFAGYYTEQNGAGVQIYSAEGKGTVLSEFDKDSVIYAHWVQPIVNIKNPESREVIAGYAGVILTTEVELSQQVGYTLTYQWYMNHENSNIGGSRIEAGDSRKLVIPQGFSVGNYYFYCQITATNALNGQSVNVFTEPAQLSVEKGTMGMEYVEVENKNCTYDGTPKVLSAAINNSNEHTIYYATEPLNEKNYLTNGTTIPNSYTDAGTYTNYIYVTGTDFADFSGSICMTILKAEPRIYLSSKNTAYNNKNQTVNPAQVYDINDQKMDMAVEYIYFLDELCTKKTDSTCGALKEGGAPSAVGTYYVHAITGETTNYKAVATQIPAMFNILGTNVNYSISGYHGVYDGKPHGLSIVNEDETNATIYFSDCTELTKDNYQLSGTKVPYEYTEIGNYSVYYIVVTKLAGEIDQYESGMAKIIIEQAKVTPDHTESGNGGNAGNGNQSSTNTDKNNSNTGSGSANNGNTEQTDTDKKHVHNYELVTFNEPTTLREGRALYRCMECGHELVITYPAVEEDKNMQESDNMLETKEDKEVHKEGTGKENKTELSTKEKIQNIESSEEIPKPEEEKKELTEAELYKIAQTLCGLTEEQVRALYEQGLLNMTQGEWERLLSILRTQIVIREEQVSLSENMPLTDEDTEYEETTKQTGMVWNLLWAFLLGAAVMYLICKIKETRKKKEPKQTQNQTRKLN